MAVEESKQADAGGQRLPKSRPRRLLPGTRLGRFVRAAELAYFASPASWVFAAWMRRRARHLYERVIRDVGPLAAGARLADIGCGHGTFIGMYLQRYPKTSALGIDQSPSLINYARRKVLPSGVPAAFEVGDVHDFELGEGVFDVIVSCSSIYLWRDPPAALDRLRDALRPGGRLLLYDQLPPATRRDVRTAIVGQKVYGFGLLGWTSEELGDFVRTSFGEAVVDVDGVIVRVEARRSDEAS